MLEDSPTKSPYDEFNERTARCGRAIRVAWRRQPHGSWIQISLVVVTAVYAIVTYRLLESANRTQQIASQQVDAANRTQQIANQQLEAFDRPWIRVELAMPGPTRILNGSAAFFPQWTLHNGGRSVATAVENEWSWYIESFSQSAFTEPIERQKETCARSDWPDRVRTGGVLFQDEISTGFGSFTVEPATLRDAQSKSPQGMATSIVLTGCVGYGYGTSTKRHHTGFIYVLTHQPTPGQAVQLTAEWLFSAPLQPGAVTVDRFFFASAPVD